MTDLRRILVVEDDVDIAAAIADQLTDAGFGVDQRHDGISGFEAARDGDYDAIVLDLMLPKRNGFSVCLDLREAGVFTPLMMLTAKDGELDEIEGLEVGADDFLRKPFEREVLLARLNALLRRHERGRPQPIVIGQVVVDPVKRIVTARGSEVALTPREYRLLEFLLLNLNRPVSKADILETVWGESFDGDPNIVEVYVGYLRRKLDRSGDPSFITTVRGVGYCISTS
jgi:two-component system OmpR family response regulator